MSFERPTLAQLIDRVQQDFVSRLELVGAVLRRSVVYVLARVIAGAAHMLHGHLDFLARQLFPDLSEDEFLVRQAALFGVAKTAPTYATGTVTFTGTDGVTVPAGMILIRSDSVEYATDGDVTISSGTATADITAVLAGADGTLIPAVVLTFESPIAGIDSTAEVATNESDGNDEETTEALRTRFLEFLAEPAHGGTSADYIAWAKEVAGVTRVWVTPLGLGPGTVVVRFVRDNDASPIPDSGEVADVQAKLDLEAPAHATPTAFAPTAAALDFEVALTPNTTATRAAVEAELTDLLLREGEPGGTILLSHITTAIGTSSGVTDFVLTDPVADVTHTANEIPTPGTITFL